GTLLLHPQWREEAVRAEAGSPAYEQHVVMLCDVGIAEQQIEGARCVRLDSQRKSIASAFTQHAQEVFEELQGIVRSRPTGPVLVQVVVPAEGEPGVLAGLSGLLKTARQENPNVIGQVVAVDALEDVRGLVEKLRENRRSSDPEVRYRQGQR